MISAKAHTQAQNESVQKKDRSHGTIVHLGLGGSDPGDHHGRDAAGETLAPLSAHLEELNTVDRGQVQDGQALSDRPDLPANAVQSHSPRRGAVSAFGCGKVFGRAAGRKEVLERHQHQSSHTGWGP